MSSRTRVNEQWAMSNEQWASFAMVIQFLYTDYGVLHSFLKHGDVRKYEQAHLTPILSYTGLTIRVCFRT